MRFRTFAVLAALASYVSPALALNADTAVPVDVSMIQEKGGIIFQNTYAQPFYVWDKDQPGKSMCDAHCADIWVPVYTTAQNPENIGDFTVIIRADGSKQWAYMGKPLYTFGYGEHPAPTAKETMNQWHILKP